MRASLAGDGRLRKYIPYAIGEILLVVIGILIALEVNNLNEQRKDRNLERTYYESLLLDLRRDSSDYEFRRINAERNISRLNNVIAVINNGYSMEGVTINPVNWRRPDARDTVALALSLAMAGFVQFPEMYDNTIEDLKSTGNLHLLRNRELRDDILFYYTNARTKRFWAESYMENRTLIDLEVNHILDVDLRSAYTSEERILALLESDIDIQAILERMKSRPELEPLVIGMIHIQNRIIFWSQGSIEDAEELKQAILDELDRLG